MKKMIMGIGMAILLGSLLTGGVGDATAQTIDLKFAHFMSPMHIQHQKSFFPFTKKVEELTGGNVKIKIFPGGALGGPKQLADAVKNGITDIAFIIPSYTTGRFPRISVLDLPFMGDNAVHCNKVIFDLWDQYFSKDFTDYKVLWMYSTGPGQFQSATKPMKSTEVFNGMKMRAPSAYMSKAFKLLGANPVGMPISKLTMSLEKKVIDGMLTPYSAVKDFRLFDLVKYISEANFYVTPMSVLMNKDKWNALPDSAKQAIDQASGQAWGFHASRVYDEHDKNTIKEIQKRGKIQIYKFPESERKKLAEKTKSLEADWVKEMSKKGIPAEEILAAAKASVKKTR